ncbi:MAG: serpin family protein [Bacteroidales bacterium]|nr:serpin family protein [Bacteroidales bacterium]
MTRFLKLSASLALACIALSCCGNSRRGTPLQSEADPSSSPMLTFTASSESVSGPRSEVSPSTTNSLTMDFSASLLRNAASQEGLADNLVLSPLSAGYALSLLLEGATGPTREELLSVLGGSFGDIVPFTDENTIVNTASSVWLKEGVAVLDSYRNAIEKKFSAQVETRDFSSRETVKEINSWCSDHTAGKIPSIVGEIPGSTVMLLLNALYFKAPWATPFNENFTKKGTFHSVAGDQKDVSFMNRNGKMDYYRCESFSSLSLPYKERYSMLFILPESGKDLSSVVSALDADTMNRAIVGASPCQVELRIPKFTIETTLNMNATLKAMGIRSAFTGGFGNMTTFPVAVSDVNQKCFLKVNEEGAEAAAVTSISMRLTSVRPETPVQFFVDRPFVFAIYDRVTKDVYFEGCIVKIEDSQN